MSRSTDNGTSWIKVRTGDVSSVVVSGEDVFMSISGGGVYCSTDNGDTWSDASIGLPALQVVCFTVAGSNLFAGTAKGVYLSRDKGASWGPVDTVMYVASLAATSTDLYVGTYSKGIYRSSDNGTTWNEANSGLPPRRISSLVVSGKNLFAGLRGDAGGIYSNTGVYMSTDGGTSWQAVNTGFAGTGSLKNTNVWSLAVRGPNLFAGTERGVWSRPLSQMVTEVKVSESLLPLCFALEQNYPNPFNPTTTINYQLPHNAHVTIKVCDVLGRIVGTLLESYQFAGEHSVQFNGDNLASGVYFCRGTASGITRVKKMILMK